MNIDLKLWAKTDKNNSGVIHSVICHNLDVGTCFALLWDDLPIKLRDQIREAFSKEQDLISDEDAKAWFSFFASSHDLGKISPEFQKKAFGKLPNDVEDHILSSYTGWKGLGTGADRTYHAAGSQAILVNRMSEFLLDKGLINDLAVVVGGHHGTFDKANPNKQWNLSRDMGWARPEWRAEQNKQFDFLVDYWKLKNRKQIVRPTQEKQFVYLLIAGLISFADWIASGNMPLVGDKIDLNDYLQQIIGEAKKAFDNINFNFLQPTGYKSLIPNDVFGFSELNELQQTCVGVARNLTEPSLVIIENSTGSGKTEAAEILAYEMIKKFNHQGIYFALPTCATSNQMFGRFMKFIPALDDSPNYQLLHGNSIFNKEYNKLRFKSEEENEVVISEWLSHGGKKKILAPFGVGTIDQLLLAVLQSKFFFIRLLGMANKVVILDEVHAFDMYTTKIIQHLIKWLKAIGCSVILLSATLPDKKKKELTEAFIGKKIEDSGSSYPRITVASENNFQEIQLKPQIQRKYTLKFISKNGNELAESIKEKISGGGCVLVLCNRVKVAQEVYRSLKYLGADHLIHAKFPQVWREENEKEILNKFDKAAWANGNRPQRSIVVATQVLEQSLDIDFDVIYTDLAPVDLILQRIGRCHRHNQTRPNLLNQPEVFVMVDDLDPDTDFPDYGSDNKIYDQYLLSRTYLGIKDLSELTLPSQTQQLIKYVYESDECIGVTKKQQKSLRLWKKAKRIKDGNASFDAESKLICDPDKEGFLNQFADSLDDDAINACDDNDLESSPFSIGFQMDTKTRKIFNKTIVCLRRSKDDDSLWELPDGTKVDLNKEIWAYPPDEREDLIEKIYSFSIKIIPFEDMQLSLPPKTWGDNSFLRYLYLVKMKYNWESKDFRLSKEFGLEIK